MTPLQIVICVILGRIKGRDMCQNAFSSCLQGVRMRRSKREEQKTDVWLLLFKKKIFKTNLNLKINVKNHHYQSL